MCFLNQLLVYMVVYILSTTRVPMQNKDTCLYLYASMMDTCGWCIGVLALQNALEAGFQTFCDGNPKKSHSIPMT